MDESVEPGARRPSPTYVNYPVDGGDRREPEVAPTYEPPYGGPVEPWVPGTAPTHPGMPPVARLADPPREVPAAMWLGVAAFSFWELFTILMVLVSPIAVWIFVPILLPFACLALFVVGGYLRVRKLRRRLQLARWGRIATVLHVEHGWGATSYQNVTLPQAVGWEVTRSSYTGQSHKSTITYLVDEQTATMLLRGRPYAGGVILADSRQPGVALCVSSFPFTMRPDDQGGLTVRIGPFAALGVVVTSSVYLALLAGAVLTLAVFG